MDEKQLQTLWDLKGKDQGFKDYNEFKGLLGNNEARKLYFEENNEELGFKDLTGFETLLGLEKQPEVPQGSEPTSQTYGEQLSNSEEPLSVDTLQATNVLQDQATELDYQLAEKGLRRILADVPVKGLGDTPLSRQGEFIIPEYAVGNNPELIELISGGKTSYAVKYLDENGVEQIAEENVVQKNKDLGVGSDLFNSFIGGLEKLNASIYDLPEYLYRLGALPQNMLADYGGLEFMRANYTDVSTGKFNPLKWLADLSEGARQTSEEYNKQVTQFEGDMLTSIDKGDWGTLGRQVGNAIAGSAPSMLLMTLTGGIGSALKMGELGTTALTMLPFASGAYKDEDESLSESTKMFTSLAKSFNEVALERSSFGTLPLLNALKNKVIGKEQLKEVVESSFKTILSKNGIPASMGKGVLSEIATEFSNEAWDVYVTNTKDAVDYRKIAESGIVGAVMDGGIRTLTAVIPSQKKTQVNELQEQIVSLKEDLDKITNHTQQQTIQESIESKVEEINQILDEGNEIISKLDDSVVEQVKDIEARIEDVQESLTDENLSDTTKEVLQEELTTLETDKQNLVSNGTKVEEDVSNEVENNDTVLFHGTPHTFTEFSLQKIGTGEGAQAFGFGLYFTNKQEIANDYANVLSTKKNFWEHLEQGNDINLTQEQFDFINNELDALGFDGSNAESHGLDTIKVDGQDVEGASVYDAMAEMFSKDFETKGMDNYGLTQEQFDKMMEIKKSITNPQMLEISVPSDLNLINWHDSVPQNVVDTIADAIEDLGTFGKISKNRKYTGKDLYNGLVRVLGGQKEASEFLDSQGFDGIVYKSDKGTGGQDGKGKNYVFFDDQLPTVTKINNQETGNKPKARKQKKTQTRPQETTKQSETKSNEEVEVEGNIPTPTQAKLKEIQSERDAIRERIRKKLGNLNAGINPELLADYIALGGTYIKEGIVRFSDWSSRLKQDLGDEAFGKLKDKQIREIFESSVIENGLKIRGFSKSVKNSPDVSNETKTIIDNTSDETIYEPQDLTQIEEDLSNMSESEKLKKVAQLSTFTGEMTADGNDAVLAGISLMLEYEASGRHAESAQIAEDLAKSGTVLGQAIRQYGQFKRATTAGFLQLVDKGLEQVGKNLNDKNKQALTDLHTKYKEAVANFDKANKDLDNGLTDARKRKLKETEKALEDSVRQMENYIAKVRGKDLGDTLAQILQGVLLVVKSLIINPFSNAIQGGVRALTNTIAYTIDLAMSKAFAMPMSKVSPITGLKYDKEAIAEGWKKSVNKSIYGASEKELTKYDAKARLNAFESLRDIIKSWSPDGKDFNEEFQRDIETRISDYVSIMPQGWTADLMFRGLPFGDDMFYQQAYIGALVEIGITNKGLKGKDLEAFVLRPDEDSKLKADAIGKEATFQDSTKIAKMIQKGLRSIENGVVDAFGGSRIANTVMKPITKALIPFVNTPVSIAGKTIRFAMPVVPAIEATLAMQQMLKLRNKKGMSKNAKEQAVIDLKRKFTNKLAETIVSLSTIMVASHLVALGLISGDMPDDVEEKKKKDFGFMSMPFNHINISGIKRMLSGEDPSPKQGDRTISYQPLGLFGAIFGIVEATRGEKLRQDLKEQRLLNPDGTDYKMHEDDSIVLDAFLSSFANAPASVKYFMNQSFVQSAESILGALAEGRYDGFANQMTKTLGTMFVPNQASQFFRSRTEYMRDLYTNEQLDTWGKLVGNAWNITKEKVGSDDDLPLRYNLWGDPVTKTPKGENPYVYQMLDIFRSQKILQEDLTYKVFELNRLTKDSGVIPSAPKDFFKEGDFTVKLNKYQKAELYKLVGMYRKEEATKVLRKFDNTIKDPKKLNKIVDRLERAYRDGAKRGKRKFMKDLQAQGIDIKSNINLRVDKLQADNLGDSEEVNN